MKIRLNELNKLPNESGVYFVWSENNECLYIGSSVNLKIRWTGHHLKKGLKERYNNYYITYLLFPNDIIRDKEKEFIKSHNPILMGKTDLIEKSVGFTMYRIYESDEEAISRRLVNEVIKTKKPKTKSEILSRILREELIRLT